MIAVDTNVLVYAHVDTLAKHELAKRALVELAEGSRPWGIPAPCLAEFLRVTTHPRVFAQPFSVHKATSALEAVLQSPTVSLLNPSETHGTHLAQVARQADVRGNLAFDAAIVAICRETGVRTFLTEDRDFDRFDGLRVVHLDEF